MVVLFVVIGLLVYWLCKARQDLKRALTEQEVKMFEVVHQVQPLLQSSASLYQNESFVSGG